MVSVIVVSFNTQEITLKCLKHLYASRGCEFEVIVVDNNSIDGSTEAIAKEYPRAKLIKNKTNPGFGAANNQAMKIARGELFLIVNSDAFVEPDTLAKCVDFLNKSPNVGVVGCRLINLDGSLQKSIGFFPSFIRVTGLMLLSASTIHIKNSAEYNKTRTVDWVMGAFMLIRREVFSKTGGFDEQFFLYGEEVEWQYRIHSAGYEVNYFADATAVHLGGASTKDKSKMFAGEMQGYKLWFAKYGNPFEKMLLPWIVRLGCILRIAAFTVVGKPEMAKIYANVLASAIAK